MENESNKEKVTRKYIQKLVKNYRKTDFYKTAPNPNVPTQSNYVWIPMEDLQRLFENVIRRFGTQNLEIGVKVFFGMYGTEDDDITLGGMTPEYKEKVKGLLTLGLVGSAKINNRYQDAWGDNLRNNDDDEPGENRHQMCPPECLGDDNP